VGVNFHEFSDDIFIHHRRDLSYTSCRKYPSILSIHYRMPLVEMFQTNDHHLLFTRMVETHNNKNNLNYMHV